MISSTMRRHIYIRPLRMYDEADKSGFVAATEVCDRFYPNEVFSLPTTKIMVAERREEHGIEIIGYQPTYVPLVLGSPVWMPSSEQEKASAMHQFTAAAYTRVNAEMLGDLLMFSPTLDTEAFALRHQYEKLHPAYRLAVR